VKARGGRDYCDCAVAPAPPSLHPFVRSGPSVVIRKDVYVARSLAWRSLVGHVLGGPSGLSDRCWCLAGPSHATRVTALVSLVPEVCVKGLPDATGARACAHDENCFSLPLIDMKHIHCS